MQNASAGTEGGRSAIDRPLRFLARHLQLDEAQGSAFEKRLVELKIEFARQVAADRQESATYAAELIAEGAEGAERTIATDREFRRSMRIRRQYHETTLEILKLLPREKWDRYTTFFTNGELNRAIGYLVPGFAKAVRAKRIRS